MARNSGSLRFKSANNGIGVADMAILTGSPESQYAKNLMHSLLCCCAGGAYINDTCACSDIPTDFIKTQQTLFFLFNLLATISKFFIQLITLSLCFYSGKYLVGK
jgi:hypothetical protein